MKQSVARALKLVGGSMILAGVGALVYSTRIEPRRYRVERISVITGGGTSKLPRLRERTLRILHLSDLHLCHPESHKVEFVRRVTEDDYDIVALTGDTFENYTGLVYALRLLARRPRLGAYAVLGNHDVYNYSMVNKTLGRLYRKFRHPRAMRDFQPMIEALKEAGFTVLRNEAAPNPAAGVHVVGIDYPTIHPEYLNELVGEAADGDLVIVLFHMPVRLENIARSGAHLALGGHTHGGQIRIPGFGALITDSELPRRQASGLFWRHGTAFHVSRGLGADPRTNIRLFCPPAATVLEVKHFY